MGFTGEKMGAEVPRTNGKQPLSEAPATTTKERTSSPPELQASVIPRSDPYGFVQVDGANGSNGGRRLGSLSDAKALATEPGVQNQSVKKPGFSGLTKTEPKSINPDPKKGVGSKSKNPDLVLCRNGDRLFGSHGCGKEKELPTLTTGRCSDKKEDILPMMSGSGVAGLAAPKSSTIGRASSPVELQISDHFSFYFVICIYLFYVK